MCYTAVYNIPIIYEPSVTDWSDRHKSVCAQKLVVFLSKEHQEEEHFTSIVKFGL